MAREPISAPDHGSSHTLRAPFIRAPEGARTVFLVTLIAAPYFLSLVSGGSGNESSSLIGDLIHIGVKNILTIVLPIIILFFFSIFHS